MRVALIGAGMWAPRLAAAAERAGLELVEAVEDADGVLDRHAQPRPRRERDRRAAAGRHVFVEKPIADTVEAAERIRDACVEAGVVLMVGHAFRRLGAARRAKELVGELGTVVLAEACFSLPGKLPPTAWRAQRARNPGGPLMQLGIHHVDTLAYLLGPVARTTGRFARVHTDAEIDDVGVATLEFESGALGVLTGSYVSPHVFSLRLQGSEGVLDYRADLGAVWPAAERVDEVSTLDAERRAGGVRAARHAGRGAGRVRRRRARRGGRGDRRRRGHRRAASGPRRRRSR